MRKSLSIFILIWAFVPLVSFASDTLYESDVNTVDDYIRVFGTIWVSIPFSGITENHDITSIKLWLHRYGTGSRTAVIYLMEDNAGEPDGTPLCTYNYDYNGLTTSGTGVETELPVECDLVESGVDYHWVIKSPDSTTMVDELDVHVDTGVENFCFSNDAGSSWNCSYGVSGYYLNYGNAIVEDSDPVTATTTNKNLETFKNLSFVLFVGTGIYFLKIISQFFI